MADYWYTQSWLCIFIIVCISERALSAETMVNALFVFGDSLVDVGNNNFIKLSLLKANFPHNGIDYTTHKATGRFSNGLNSADFLALKLGFVESPAPFMSMANQIATNINITLKGVNFASGGSGILDEISVQSLSLNKQIQSYEKVYSGLAAELGGHFSLLYISKSLFAVSIGSNDLISYFKSSSKLSLKYTPEEYINYLITTLKTQLQTLYNLGARKFVIGGVGPIGCCPKQRISKSKTGDCIKEENDLAEAFNTAVLSLLKDIATNLTGVRYAVSNTYAVLSEYIQNPSVHGFKEVSKACCGAGNLNAQIPCIPVVKYCANRSEYVFWDLYHPTENVAKMCTDVFFDGPLSLISPVNVKQLVQS